MSNQIIGKIVEEIDDFKNNKVKVADGYEFNQLSQVHENIRYYNSVFKGGITDSEGFRKYFFNIVKNPCNSASKAIAFRPKDIMIIAAPGHPSTKAWLANLDFRHWVKESGFSETLSQIFYALPKEGSCVLKVIGNIPYNVDLRNLVNEQSADTLAEASYVIEQRYYGVDEFRKLPFDNVDEALGIHRKTKDKYLRVFERYGEVPENYIREDGDPEKYVYSRSIVYMPESSHHEGKNPIGEDSIYGKGVVLDIDEFDREDFPYREFHFEKIPGRWLGVSRIEVLKDPQVRTNEITNLRVKSSYFSSLNLWQSRDDNFKKNLIKEVANGDVITAMDEIRRIPTEDRDLTGVDMEERKWQANRDENTFTYDVVRGERLPAGTPLGSAQLASQMVESYFLQIRERVARQVKELLMNDIFPRFKNTPEHYIKLTGEDFDIFKKMMVKHRALKEIFRQLVKTRTVPTSEQYSLIKKVQESKIKSGDIRIPENYWEDLRYEIDIEITGEERDMRMQSANMGMIMQMIQQDPQILDDPRKRKIMGKLLEAVGISIEELDVGMDAGAEMEHQVQQQGQMRGGGVSAPAIPTGAAGAATPETTV